MSKEYDTNISPDIYISTTNPQPSATDYMVRGLKWGGENLLLCPTREGFILGTYFIAVAFGASYGPACNYTLVVSTEGNSLSELP
jgi:hypothetical protein